MPTVYRNCILNPWSIPDYALLVWHFSRFLRCMLKRETDHNLRLWGQAAIMAAPW